MIIALQRTNDPHNLQSLRHHLDKLSAIDPSPDAVLDSWPQLEESMQSLLDVVTGLQSYSKVSLFVLYVCITCFQKTAWSAQVTCSFLKRHSTLFLSMYLKLYCGDIFVRNDCVSAPLVLILTIIVFSELQLTS